MLFLIALFLFCVFVVMLYNKLVKLRNLSENATSDIDVQLKRRYDLIPNLVETVKGYAKHEEKTLEKVINARNRAISVNQVSDKSDANKELSVRSDSFLPFLKLSDLKANQNFISLQNSLSAIEDDIQNSRRFYNAVVRDLNTAIDSFPSNMIAGILISPKKSISSLKNQKKKNRKRFHFHKRKGGQ
jgi:LemA protein